MTKRPRKKIVGQIMGVWFLAASVGSFMGGEIAGLFESLPLPQLFGAVAAVNLAVAVLVFAIAPGQEANGRRSLALLQRIAAGGLEERG
jgi:POT family proton-dependent oligopeptide transporter